MKSGVQLKVAVPLRLSVYVAPLGRAELVITGVVPSASEAVATKFKLTFSSVDWAPIVARTGDKLT